MQIDIKRKLVDLDGEPLWRQTKLPIECPHCGERFFEGDPPQEKPWHLGDVMAQAVTVPDEKLSGDEKMTHYQLALTLSANLRNGEPTCELSTEDLATIKKAIGKYVTNVMIAGQAMMMIEDAKSIGEMKPDLSPEEQTAMQEAVEKIV